MKSENITLEKIEGIYDIYSLTPPPLSAAEQFLILVAFTASIILLAYYFWKQVYSRKGIAQRNIKKLLKLYQTKNITPHDTVYQLCSHLKHGLNIKQISIENTLTTNLQCHLDKYHLDQCHMDKWHLFIEKLNTLRYNKINNTKQEIESAFNESLFWLKLWR